MDIQAFIHVALAGTLVVSYGARMLPRHRETERRRQRLAILCRLKACGRTSYFELDTLCRSSNTEQLLAEMEREDLATSFIDKSEPVAQGDKPTVYYTITSRGERYMEEHTVRGRAS